MIDIENLIEDKIYNYNTGNENYIILYILDKYCYAIHNKNNFSKRNFTLNGDFIKVASNDEKDWLLTCISVGQFIPFDKRENHINKINNNYPIY